jgi:hypothetical protein
MRSFIVILIVTIFLIISSCKEESVTNPVTENNNLVKANVDLQSGFAGKIVVVEFNKERTYQSNLSNIVSLAGPEASFITYIQKGKNNLFVLTQNPELPSEYFADSTIINIGDKKEYFLGLQISDSLKCIVQDSSFFYM